MGWRTAIASALALVAAQTPPLVTPLGETAPEEWLAAVASQTEAFFPGETRLIAGARVSRVDVAPRGRYALVAQEDVPPPVPVAGRKTNAPGARTGWLRTFPALGRANRLSSTPCANARRRPLSPPPVKATFPVLLAPHAERSFLLSDHSAVLYVADGILYARVLARVSRHKFDAAQKAAYVAQALQNAYAIGQALGQFARDNQGAFPLRYTFAGGKIGTRRTRARRSWVI